MKLNNYRKKPVKVTAFQFFPDEHRHGAPISGGPLSRKQDWRIRTLEGEMHIGSGDYVVKGKHEGEWWPVRCDIFEETYERVND